MALTSLGAQLRALEAPASAAVAPGRSRASLLFDPATAATLDAAAVHRIGLDGLEELGQLDPEGFRRFEAGLFAESAVRVQRAVLGKAENARVDAEVEAFCLQAGPFFLLKATHKALEWLLFRFAVHEYNIGPLLRLALPYHDSNFALKLIQALRIPPVRGPHQVCT